MKVKWSKRAAIEFAATAAYVAAEFGPTAPIPYDWRFKFY